MNRFIQIIIIRIDPWVARWHEAKMASESSMSSKELRDAWVRKWVAAFLIFLAAVALLEVVIAPGSMIRNHLRAAAPPTDQAIDGETARDSLLQDQFTSLHKDVQTGWDEISRDAQERFQIDLSSVDANEPPASLAAEIQSSPTAREVWSQLVLDASDIARVLTRTNAKLSSSNLPNPARPLSAGERALLNESVDELANSQKTLQQVKAELDHLSLLASDPHLQNPK
jgi:hypothetical protein